MIFFFFTKCCAIFFVVDKNLFNASSNIFMSDIHNNLTRHIFHIYVLNILKKVICSYKRTLKIV